MVGCLLWWFEDANIATQMPPDSLGSLLPWHYLSVSVFLWEYCLQNSSHLHPAVLVGLNLFLELIYTMAVCLKMIIMWFTCGLGACHGSWECVPGVPGSVSWIFCHKGTHRCAFNTALPAGNPHGWSWNALPVRKGWLISFYQTHTHTACENGMQRRHKHFQGILTAGSPCFHDL